MQYKNNFSISKLTMINVDNKIKGRPEESVISNGWVSPKWGITEMQSVSQATTLYWAVQIY